MASGWTGQLISPDMRVHDAASAAIQHVASRDSLRAQIDPNHPDHPAIPPTIRVPAVNYGPGQIPAGPVPTIEVPNPAYQQQQNAAGSSAAAQILNDPKLGSRTTGANHPPAGTIVGSASTFQNAGIPATIQSAMGNLNTNTQTNSIANLLRQVLGGYNGNVQNQVSPEQNAYFQSQTALNNTRNQALQAPGQIQTQIDALTPAPKVGVMNMTPALPGQYNPANDAALQNLYGQQATARKAASGWTSPTY